MIEAGAPRARAAADVLEERRQDLLPVGRVDDLGVELDAVERRARRPRARRPATRSSSPARVKPGGGSKTVSRCDIQHVCSAGVPASSRPGSATVSCERPNSPTSAPSTRPPSVQHQRLHAVTDAEHRDPELEQLRIQPRRARRRTPTPGRRTGSAPSAGAAAPPRRRRGAAAARRTRRTRARGARSAASTGRRSRGRRPRRSRPRARARAPPGAGRPRRPTRAPRQRSSVCDKRHSAAARAHADLLVALELLALASAAPARPSARPG